MPRDFELTLTSNNFVGDNDAQLVAGDGPATPKTFKGRLVWAFDDTAEEAIVSQPFAWPTAYASGAVTASVCVFMASDNTNDIAVDVFVEAVSSGDTIDLESATSWDSANSGTVSLSGTTAGDPVFLTITLANKDSVVAGDIVRIGIRRDCDSANDDATGDMYFSHVEIYEA